jgi:hypothetical protein
MRGRTPGRGAMLAGTLQTWSTRQIAVRQRLERRCTSSLLCRMVVTTQHALPEAARCARRPPSLVAQRVQAPAKVAITTLAHRSTTPSRPCATARQRLAGLPWKLVLVIDRPRQHRARLHPANAKTCKHGQGDVSGHPWTTRVLLLGGLRMPLRPLPCESQPSCQAPGLP